MTVGEMIEQLKTFPPEWEVLVTDGIQAACYRGGYAIVPWQDDDGKMCVDIAIGGLNE